MFFAVNGVPAGFETLSRPQRSLIDIYYGNRYITTQLATFTPETIELASPAEIVRRITDITQPTLVTELLTGELPNNANEICLSGQRQGCGMLTPQVVEVIFNEGSFRLDLFINRDYLLARPADVRKYLPPSESEVAFLQNFSVAASGNSSSENNNSSEDYTLSGLSMLSWRENSVYASWDYTKDRHFTVDNLYAQREFEGLAWQGGMVSGSSFGLNFTSSQTLLGGRVATSDNTRLDDDFSSGIPLDVFLPTRGRVELRRDDRLLYSEFFEAGNQQLNSSSLPDGAYDLEIRVVDELGNVLSTQTRFFAKQYSMPAPGEWRWFAEAGNILNRTADDTLPRATKQYLGRGGVARRLSDTWSGTLAAAMDNDEQLVELGLLNVGRYGDVSPSAMASAAGDKAVGLNVSTRVAELSLSGNYRRLWGEKNPATRENSSQNELVGESFEQYAASAGIPFLQGSLNYRYSYNHRDDDTTKTHSVDWRTRVWRTSDYDIDLDLGVSKSGDDRIVLATLEFSYRSDRWRFGVTPAVEWSKTANDSRRRERTRLSAGWDDGERFEGDLRFDGGLSLEGDDKRANGTLRYADHRGSGSLALSHLRSGSNRVTSYSLNVSTSLITDGEFVSIGGDQRSQSAVVVDIEGRDGDRFDVMVNGQRNGYAVVGQPSIVPLSPYREYRISVVPAGTAIYQFEEKVQRITLYPGNVMRMEVEAIPMQLAFGRILFNDQAGFSGRIMGGQAPMQVSDSGLFQIEVRADTPELRLEMDNGWACTIDLGNDTNQDIVRLGTINLTEADCQPVSEGALVLNAGDSKSADNK